MLLLSIDNEEVKETEVERLEERVAELEDDVKYLTSDKDTLEAENKVSMAAHLRQLF